MSLTNVHWNQERTRNIKEGSQILRNSFHSTSFSNFILNFSINFNFAEHALTRSKGLKHSTSGSHGHFLLKKSTNQGGQFATNTYKM